MFFAFSAYLEHLLRDYDNWQDMPPCTMTAIIGAFGNLAGLPTASLDLDSFQNRAANSFSVPFSCSNYCRMMNDCCSAYKISFVHFVSNPSSCNIGQSYRLCLQIEWHCSQWRQPRGVLGYPDSCRAVQQARWINFANGK